MPNATVNINIAIQSRRMKVDERFTPTEIRNEPFNYQTDLENYLDQTSDIASSVYTYIDSMRDDGWTNFLQLEARLDNVTHVATAAGVVPLPKGHRSAGLTGEEITEASDVEDFINTVVADLKQKARY